MDTAPCSADSKEKGDAFLAALYAAYFVDSKNISDISVLSEIAGSVGLPPAQVTDILEAGRFRDRVDRDWAEAETLNIMVLPTFLINEDRLVGAQPYHKLERLLEKNGVSKKEP